MVLLKYAGVAQDRQSLTRSKLCNSTFLFDKTTNFSPKLEEFREIVHELAVEEKRKVAVFSEYERMTHLASQELTKLKLGWFVLARQGARAETWRADCAVKKGSRLQGVSFDRCWRSRVELAGGLGSREL